MTEEASRSAAEQLHAIDQWAEHWSRHDMDSVIEQFTTDLVYEDVPTARVNHGGEELRAFGAEVFAAAQDVSYEVTYSFVQGGRGSAEWTMRGTHTGTLNGLPPTGKAFEVRGTSVFEFDGSKIKRCSDYWDLTTLLRQLGVMR